MIPKSRELFVSDPAYSDKPGELHDWDENKPGAFISNILFGHIDQLKSKDRRAPEGFEYLGNDGSKCWGMFLYLNKADTLAAYTKDV